MTSKTFDQLDKNTKHALDVLARKFESARKVDEKGRTVFDGTSTLALPEVLGGLGVIPDILPDTVQRRLANQAAFKAAQSGPITARSLWLATQSGYKEYLKTPLTRYILATTLPTGSINNDYATTLNDAKILVTRYLPRRFEKTRRSVIADAKEYILGDAPPLFENGVVVRVLAREHHAAFEMALRQLDLLRGIWNLWENRNTQFRWTSGRVRPFNKFLLGPVHTLHKPDGALAHDSWWYETHYVRPSFSSMRDSEISSRQKFTKQVRLLLRQSKYRVPLESAIVRYSRALDFDDTNTSFLQLWSVLEYLTGISDSRDGSAALIRRASYLSADPEYTRHELNVLRNHRNESVHAESRKGDADTYRILTKNHVERLLEFHLATPLRFENISDAATLLDLPLDATQIKKRIRLLKHVLRERR